MFVSYLPLNLKTNTLELLKRKNFNYLILFVFISRKNSFWVFSCLSSASLAKVPIFSTNKNLPFIIDAYRLNFPYGERV